MWKKYIKESERKQLVKSPYLSWRNKVINCHDMKTMIIDNEKIDWHDSYNLLVKGEKGYYNSRLSQGDVFIVSF